MADNETSADIIAMATTALAAPVRNRDAHTADPDWKNVCAKCKDGDIEPKYCEYYGEPNGCNSPIYGEHPTAEKSSVVGDAAKLREALSDACYAMFNFLRAQNGGYEEIANALDKAKAALAAPPRNCDMGDAADWEKRFGEECDKGHICSKCPVRHTKTRMAVELDKGARCEFVWAQMPYEEGGAK